MNEHPRPRKVENLKLMSKAARYISSSPQSEMSSAMILSVGIDPQHLISRASFLVRTGVMVVSALSLAEAVHLFQIGGFDLVLLCHSLTVKDRERLTCLIRASGSSIPVLSVSENRGKRNRFANATFDDRNTEQLLVGIRQALGTYRNRNVKSIAGEAGPRRPRDSQTTTGITRLLMRTSITNTAT